MAKGVKKTEKETAGTKFKKERHAEATQHDVLF
jgi:hypothetical protein